MEWSGELIVPIVEKLEAITLRRREVLMVVVVAVQPVPVLMKVREDLVEFRIRDENEIFDETFPSRQKLLDVSHSIRREKRRNMSSHASHLKRATENASNCPQKPKYVLYCTVPKLGSQAEDTYAPRGNLLEPSRRFSSNYHHMAAQPVLVLVPQLSFGGNERLRSVSAQAWDSRAQAARRAA